MKFVVAAMNGGKTTLLLQTVHSWRSRGFPVLLLKPADDTRTTTIASRIGAEAEVDIFIKREDNLEELLTDYFRRKSKKHALVVVDEAQFLTVAQVEDLFLYSLGDTPVICYGLKTDFQGRAFPGAARLMELAEVEELRLIRCRCGRKACFNARFDKESGELISEGPKKLIEGSKQDVIYDPLCPSCFVKLGGFTRKAPRKEEQA